MEALRQTSVPKDIQKISGGVITDAEHSEFSQHLKRMCVKFLGLPVVDRATSGQEIWGEITGLFKRFDLEFPCISDFDEEKESEGGSSSDSADENDDPEDEENGGETDDQEDKEDESDDDRETLESESGETRGKESEHCDEDGQ